MQVPPKPANEAARLEALRSYRLLDSEPERCFDDLVKLASYITGCPVAALSLIDENRQWLKAKVGLEINESAREISFCGYVVASQHAMIVEDASKDPRFHDNPMVCGVANVRFYAGFPLMTHDGFPLGSLCVIDQVPRVLTKEQLNALDQLAKQAVDQFHARLRVIELETQQRQFDAIIANVGDMIWASNAEMTKNEFLSPAFETIFERPRSELISDPSRFLSYLHPDDRESMAKQISSKGFETTFRIVRPSGEIRWVNSRAFQVTDADGAVIKMVGITTDITERVQQEQLIENQRAQLVSSNRLMSLGEMAAGIAHEINNPLAIIGGLAQILRVEVLRSDFKPELASQKLEKIHQTVNRIAKIITSLKSLARDSTKEEMSAVNLQDVVSDALDLCQTRFRNRNIDLEVIGSEAKQLVSAHRFQLAQVLVNLLNNAFDATVDVEHRSIQVEIRDQSDYVTLSVVDNGPDIPSEVLEKLMQPFFTTKAPGHGLGIGLSLSKSLVEGFGGRLRFHRGQNLTEVSATFPKLNRSAVA